MSFERKLPYTIIKSERRSFEIAVLPNGIVRIRAPKRATDHDIHRVYETKYKWIEAKLQEFQKRHPGYAERRFVSGEPFLYMGKEFKLEIVHGVKSVRIIDNEIVVGLSRSKGYDEDRLSVEKNMKTWYRQCSESVIQSRMDHWQQIVGKVPTSVKVKEQKKRWGSCTGKNEILMNWKLIMAPLDVIDYVVVHELCHLYIRDHSPRYWELVEKHMPNWKEKRQWLKQNGHLLMM